MLAACNTIFGRILLATIAPLLIIFSLIVFSSNKIIHTESESLFRETALFFAEQLSIRISSQFAGISSSLDMLRQNLEYMDVNAPFSEDAADKLLTTMLRNSGAYNAWFGFEPGTFRPDSYFSRSYLKNSRGELKEIFDTSSRILSEHQSSPWYNIPLKSGRPYFNVLSAYDYGTGQGVLHVGEIVYPVRQNGKTLGCVGVDILYDRLLESAWDVSILGEKRSLVLITDDRLILYSTDPHFSRGTNAHLPPLNGLDEAIRSDRALFSQTINPETGQPQFFCLSPVKDTPLWLYMELPDEVLSARAVRLMETIAITSVLGFVLLAACIFLAARTIVRPIRHITEKANIVAEGRLDVNFDGPDEVSTSKELEVLRAALKSMLEQLNQMHTFKLNAITSDLEREKMRAAAQAKSRFFAKMSHEIRTPMNAITGLAEILLSGELDTAQRKHVQDIRMSASALLSLINDILDSAKMETGKLRLTPKHYNFLTLLNNICSITSLMAQDKGLLFESSATGELPLCLFGDAERLRQVLLNLLSNAVKYTKAGFVRLHIANEGETLLFEIADSGMGIRDSALSLIFDAYSQVSESQTKQIEGTGLGLNIAYNLVKMMEGSIWVESTYGSGSTFYVRVPNTPGDASKLNEESDAHSTPLWDAYALVVDDNQVNLNVAQGLLTLHGLICDVALSGPEALKLAKENPYDLVFMDHMMPGMDGVETTIALRELGGRCETVPVIALTANAVPGVKSMLLDKGMDDFLAKPISVPQLRQLLATWLPGREKSVRDEEAKARGGDTATLSPGLFQEAAEIEGLEVEVGLSRVAGSQEAYEQCLRLSAEGLGGALDALHQAFKNSDLSAIHAGTHNLKGMLANIGAMSLSKLALGLETAATAGDFPYLKEHFAGFYEQLRRFHAALVALVAGSRQEQPRPPGDPALLEAGLRQLRSLLEEYDYEAAVAVLGPLLAHTFGKEQDARLKSVKSSLDRFAYDEALARLMGS